MNINVDPKLIDGEAVQAKINELKNNRHTQIEKSLDKVNQKLGILQKTSEFILELADLGGEDVTIANVRKTLGKRITQLEILRRELITEKSKP